MIDFLKYWQKCHLEEGEDFFSIIPDDRIWNNGCKLQEDGFRAIQQWNILLGRWWFELSTDGCIQAEAPLMEILIEFLHWERDWM